MTTARSSSWSSSPPPYPIVDYPRDELRTGRPGRRHCRVCRSCPGGGIGKSTIVQLLTPASPSPDAHYIALTGGGCRVDLGCQASLAACHAGTSDSAHWDEWFVPKCCGLDIVVTGTSTPQQSAESVRPNPSATRSSSPYESVSTATSYGPPDRTSPCGLAQGRPQTSDWRSRSRPAGRARDSPRWQTRRMTGENRDVLVRYQPQ